MGQYRAMFLVSSLWIAFAACGEEPGKANPNSQDPRTEAKPMTGSSDKSQDKSGSPSSRPSTAATRPSSETETTERYEGPPASAQWIVQPDAQGNTQSAVKLVFTSVPTTRYEAKVDEVKVEGAIRQLRVTLTMPGPGDQPSKPGKDIELVHRMDRSTDVEVVVSSALRGVEYIRQPSYLRVATLAK